jgi:hypothetical protein
MHVVSLELRFLPMAMKSSIYWGTVLCCPLKVNEYFIPEDHTLYSYLCEDFRSKISIMTCSLSSSMRVKGGMNT